jgi:hypothetical protein
MRSFAGHQETVMLAVKNRRASEYVMPSPVPQQAVVVALAGDAAVEAVASPARMMQAELAARLAGGVDMRPTRSLRWRAAMVIGAAILCWVPIAAAAALIFA